jgi:hypothetical protein
MYLLKNIFLQHIPAYGLTEPEPSGILQKKRNPSKLLGIKTLGYGILGIVILGIKKVID